MTAVRSFRVICQSQGEGDSSGDSGQTGVAVEDALPKVNEPVKYAVFLHNDDYSTFEFVVEVLKKFFNKSESEAHTITLAVHHQGRGVAGVYSFEIAETKVSQVNEYARGNGFPLKSSSEAV